MIRIFSLSSLSTTSLLDDLPTSWIFWMIFPLLESLFGKDDDVVVGDGIIGDFNSDGDVDEVSGCNEDTDGNRDWDGDWNKDENDDIGSDSDGDGDGYGDVVNRDIGGDNDEDRDSSCDESDGDSDGSCNVPSWFNEEDDGVSDEESEKDSDGDGDRDITRFFDNKEISVLSSISIETSVDTDVKSKRLTDVFMWFFWKWDKGISSSIPINFVFKVGAVAFEMCKVSVKELLVCFETNCVGRSGIGDLVFKSEEDVWNNCGVTCSSLILVVEMIRGVLISEWLTIEKEILSVADEEWSWLNDDFVSKNSIDFLISVTFEISDVSKAFL